MVKRKTMPYPIDQKLVIAVASSARFDLKDYDRAFRQQGEKAHLGYEEANLHKPPGKGVTFPFVRRFWKANRPAPRFPH